MNYIEIGFKIAFVSVVAGSIPCLEELLGQAKFKKFFDLRWAAHYPYDVKGRKSLTSGLDVYAHLMILHRIWLWLCLAGLTVAAAFIALGAFLEICEAFIALVRAAL